MSDLTPESDLLEPVSRAGPAPETGLPRWLTTLLIKLMPRGK